MVTLMSEKYNQIFVSGTWRTEKAAKFADELFSVGQAIANAEYDLACGPGTGAARHAVDGYRSVTTRGKVRYFLPEQSHMLAVGEEVAPGHDEIVQTEMDYPIRNVFQISHSRGLIAVTGGDGTLEEILPALIDYNIPVGILKASGQAADALALLVDVFPNWREQLLIDASIDKLVKFVLDRAERN